MNISDAIGELDKKGRYHWFELTSATFGKLKITKSMNDYYSIKKGDSEDSQSVKKDNIQISDSHSFIVAGESQVIVKKRVKEVKDDLFMGFEE